MIVRDTCNSCKDGVINCQKRKNLRYNLIDLRKSCIKLRNSLIKYRVGRNNIISSIFLCIEVMLLVDIIGVMAEMMINGIDSTSIQDKFFKNRSLLTCKNQQLRPMVFSMSKNQISLNLITNFIWTIQSWNKSSTKMIFVLSWTRRQWMK